MDGKDAVSSVDETTEALKRLDKTTSDLEKSTSGTTSSVNKASRAVKDLSKSSSELEKNIAGATRDWSTFIISINSGLDILEKASRYAKSAFDFLKDGASYTEAKESFDDYAKILGVNSNAIVSSLRKASAKKFVSIGEIRGFGLLKACT